MTLAFLVFFVAGRELVSIFLSTSFLPAVPIIQTYLLGDVLTVWASLAMYTAFARGRPAQYAAIEIGTVSLIAVIAIALMEMGDPRAPQLAYVAAYAVTAVLVTIAFLWSSGKSAARRRRARPRSPHDARQRPHPGIDGLIHVFARAAVRRSQALHRRLECRRIAAFDIFATP